MCVTILHENFVCFVFYKQLLFKERKEKKVEREREETKVKGSREGPSKRVQTVTATVAEQRYSEISMVPW